MALECSFIRPARTYDTTSAATPVVAGVFAKINELRLANGKSPLGFLNPLLYANPHVFNDVVIGQNGGIGNHKGFPSTVGWDACTGLGTPDFEKMKAL